jgi:hypothetical protein
MRSTVQFRTKWANVSVTEIIDVDNNKIWLRCPCPRAERNNAQQQATNGEESANHGPVLHDSGADDYRKIDLQAFAEKSEAPIRGRA